jgi:hypothetical protein
LFVKCICLTLLLCWPSEDFYSIREVAFLLQLRVLMGRFRVPNFLPQKWLYGRGIPKPYSSIRKFNFYIPKSQLDEFFWMLIYLSPMD